MPSPQRIALAGKRRPGNASAPGAAGAEDLVENRLGIGDADRAQQVITYLVARLAGRRHPHRDEPHVIQTPPTRLRRLSLCPGCVRGGWLPGCRRPGRRRRGR